MDGGILSVDPKGTEPASEGYGGSVGDAQMLAATVAEGFGVDSLLEGTQVQTITSPGSETEQKMSEAAKTHFKTRYVSQLIQLMDTSSGSAMTMEDLMKILKLFPKYESKFELCQMSVQYFAAGGELTKEKAADMVKVMSLLSDNGPLYEAQAETFWRKLMKLLSPEACVRFMQYFEVQVTNQNDWQRWIKMVQVILVFRGCNTQTQFSGAVDSYGRLQPSEAKEMFDFMRLFDTGAKHKFSQEDLDNFVAVIGQYVTWRKMRKHDIPFTDSGLIKLNGTTMPVLKSFLFDTLLLAPGSVASELVTKMKTISKVPFELE